MRGLATMRLTAFEIAVLHLRQPSGGGRPDLPINIGGGRNLLVKVTDERGLCGWGESSPRVGIRGESVETAKGLLHEQILPPLLGLELDNFEQAAAAMERLLGGLDPLQLAAFCAAELAVLDLAGRRFGVAACEILGRPRRDSVHYSGSIDASDPEVVRDQAAILRRRGVGSVRIRMGVDLTRNLQRLDIARQILGEEVALLIDPEQRWDSAQALQQLKAMAGFHLAGVEQPVPAADLEGMQRITAAGLAPVIAAGRVQTRQDVERLAETGGCDSISIRIAHCGGLHGAGRVHAAARTAGLGCLLGAPRQEIGLLGAAGRQFGTRAEGLTWMDECAALARSESAICEPNVTAGPGGVAPPLPGPGLGTTPHTERIEPLLRQKISVH